MYSFLRPKKVAVVGASRRDGSLGKKFLDSMMEMGFTGQILPVNPKAETINNLPCYASIEQLPSDVDMAALILPHHLVATALRQLGEKDIHSVIIISAGFKEIGGEGVAREQELLTIAKEYNINLVGPNCMGLFNSDPKFKLNASFSPIQPQPGNVAFVSQSGALGVVALDMSIRHNHGFSVFVSMGNKSDIDEVDALEFLGNDENTKVILLYLESIDRPAAFRKICSKVVKKKPVLVVKAGQFETASRAAASHTGALASPDIVVDAFLKQCGAIRCETLEEMLDASLAMAFLEPFAGKNVAIISGGGGPCILATDALERVGFNIPTLSEKTQKLLQQYLPEEASTVNPVDMIASAGSKTYSEVFTELTKADEVDVIMVVIVHPPGDSTPLDIANAMKKSMMETNKAVAIVLMTDRDQFSGIQVYHESHIPVFSFNNEAAESLIKLQHYHQIREKFNNLPSLNIPSDAQNHTDTKNSKQLPAQEVITLLEKYNLELAPCTVTTELNETLNFWQKHQQPVVLKTANEEIIHKSDAGLVALNLNSEEEIKACFLEFVEKTKKLVPQQVTPKVLIQNMVKGFPELVLGAKRDPLFGAVIMLGFGGILVEAIKDVTFRVAPLNQQDVIDMIEELRAKVLLDGVRHHQPVDKTQLIKMVLQLSELMIENPQIAEMDLNPVIWSPKENKLLIVDQRMTTT